MIIDEENIRVQYESTAESPIVAGDVLPFPYRFTEKEQLNAVLSDGTKLIYKQDYTVGETSITLSVNIPIGDTITVYRSTPLDQGSEFPQEAKFNSKKIEDALDKLTMQNQEQREALGRTLRLPLTASIALPDLSLPSPEPNKSIKWNADCTALVNTNYDLDLVWVTTESFKDQAQQAAVEAENYKNVATQQATIATEQANIATEQATIATNKTSEVVTSGNDALSNIGTAKSEALTEIETLHSSSVDDITNLKSTSISNITTAKNNAITSITNQETTSKNNIINEGATQVGLVRQEGINRVEEILETGCIDVDYTAETSTLTFTGGGSALLSNYYTKDETDSLIPTNNNQLVNGAGYITTDYHDNTKQNVITDLDTIRSGASKGATALQSYTETDPVYIADKPNIALKSEIPTKVSSFTNDANYQTATDVASMIASIPQFKLSIVDSLPETGAKMTLYLVSKGGESPDVYDEYIWIEQTSSFEHLGTTAVDLSEYYTKTEADVLLADKQPKMAIVTTQNTYNDVKAFLEEGRTVYFNYSNRLLICDSMSTATIFTFQSAYHATNMYWALCGLRADGKTAWQSGSAIVALKSNLPTTTSQLTNDSGFVTQDSLLEKTTETWTFTLEDGTTTTKTMVLGA